MHAVVEHADAGEQRAGDEAVRNHLHHRALQAQPRRVDVVEVAHQRERDEDAQGHEAHVRSEENTSELQSLMRISYAVFCLKKKTKKTHTPNNRQNNSKT